MKAAMAGMILTVVLTGCFSPFGEAAHDGSDSARTGTVVLTLSEGLTASSSGAMVPAVADQIATYEVVFTDGPVIGDITDPGQPVAVSVPEGTWTVFARGFNTDGVQSARSDNQTVTVVADETQSLPQPLTVKPRQLPNTTGSAALEVTVPSGAISEVVNVTLVARDDQTVPSPVPEFDLISATTLSWAMPELPIGRYLLTAELVGPDGRGTIATRSYLNLALEVFTNLESRYVSAVDGSTGLVITEAQISSPPEAPTDLMVTVSPTYMNEDPPADPPNAQVDLDWTANAVTASGYRVFVDGIETTPLDNFDPWRALSVPVPAAQEVTVEVVAYNGFGESEPVSWTGTVPAQPEVVSPLSGEYVAPGTVTLEWNAAAGADSYVVGVGGSQLSPDQEFTVDGDETSFDFTEGFAGSSYSWYVFAVNGSVSGRVVNSNSAGGFFRIRDGVYVNSDVPASGDGGSPTTAFGTLGEALTAAVPGETITMTAGTYTEAVSVNTPDLTIQGEGDGTLLKSIGTESATLTVNSGGSGLVLRNLQIQPSEAWTRAAIRVFGQNVTITDNLISDSQSTEVDPPPATLRGISGGAPGLVVANNRFELAQSTDTVNTRFGINLTGDGLDAANPIVIESNTFTFGDAPGSSLVGIQPQAKFYRVTNNVVVHNGTAGGPDFTGLRVATAATESVSFLHNTVVNENPNRTFTGLALDAATDTVATNNIFQGTGAASHTGVNPSGGSASEVNANLFFDLNSVAGPSWGDTVTELNGQTFATGNVSVDPWLEGTNNYAPSVANAPIELRAGGDPSSLGVVPTDYTGFERTAPISIGAYEVDQEGDVTQFALLGEWLLNGDYANSTTADLSPTPTGTLINTVDRNSAAGAALMFDGGQSASIAGDDTWGPDSTAGDTLTVSFWAKDWAQTLDTGALDASAMYYTVFAMGNRVKLYIADNGSDTAYVGYASGGYVATGVAGSESGNLYSILDFGNAAWTHFAVVIDWSGGVNDGIVQVYVNGDLVNEVPRTSGTWNNTANNFAPFSIASVAALANFQGSLDDIRLYQRALSPSEIAGLAAE